MGYAREISARQKALDLVKKRDGIEAEMDQIVFTLTATGAPGMSGNLVDADGFPRADIDILAVRTQRQRFAILKTDHKSISDEIEKLLPIALARPEGDENEASASETSFEPVIHTEIPQVPSEPEVTSPSTNAAPQEPQKVAFAVVDLVANSSPASSADLRVGDRVVSFGGISLRDFHTPPLTMAALPAYLRGHEDQPLMVEVLRADDGGQESLLSLSLTPARWSGHGLLGCHIVPVEVSQVDERYVPQVATAVARHGR